MLHSLRCGIVQFFLLYHLKTVFGALLFPEGAPSRIKLIAGLGIPLSNLQEESVTIGYLLMAQYPLPVNETELYPPYPLFPLNFNRRFRRSNSDKGTEDTGDLYEKYNADVVEIESVKDIPDDDEDDDDNMFEFDWEKEKVVEPDTKKSPIELKNSVSRWILYRGIEQLIEKNGLVGRSCLLRAICEASQNKFSQKNGILEEIVHIVLTPSTSTDHVLSRKDTEYFRAEQFGKRGEPCDKIFVGCRKSVLNSFSTIMDHLWK